MYAIRSYYARSPAWIAEPSTTVSTRNSSAISRSGRVVPLKRIAEVREITRNAPIWASSVIRARNNFV